jgi:hypothetical protein
MDGHRWQAYVINANMRRNRAITRGAAQDGGRRRSSASTTEQVFNGRRASATPTPQPPPPPVTGSPALPPQAEVSTPSAGLQVGLAQRNPGPPPPRLLLWLYRLLVRLTARYEIEVVDDPDPPTTQSAEGGGPTRRRPSLGAVPDPASRLRVVQDRRGANRLFKKVLKVHQGIRTMGRKAAKVAVAAGSPLTSPVASPRQVGAGGE